MSESDSNDVRDLLGTALRDEPPSALDPARLMRLGRRRVRWQRASAALGVMVVAGGIALGAGLIHQGGGNGPGPDRISTAGTSGAPSSIPATPTGPFSATETPSVYLPNAQLILARQNQALQTAWPPAKGVVVSSGALTFLPVLPVKQGYSGGQFNVRVSDKTGSGDFSMTTTVTDSPLNPMTCTDSLMNCQVQPINGITVEIETDHPTAYTTRILTVAANGNVAVNGEVDNLASPDGKTATRPSPPLSADQLARITAAVAAASK